MHQDRFIKAVKESGITQVVIIDDAFDPPSINDDSSGAFLDYLEDEQHVKARRKAGLTDEEASNAIDAISRGAYEEEAVQIVVHKLYEQYVTTLNSKFDPGDVFKVAKGDNLKNLMPLLALLAKCSPPLTITRVGSDWDAIEAVPDDTHLIFVDFYLDKSLAADDASHGKKKKNAKEASLDRVRRIMEAPRQNTPSVVLMSSHKVRKDAESFRSNIGGGAVFASRFAFIEKTDLTGDAQTGVTMGDDSADALLDIVQTYKFGRGLHAALTCWINASQNAAKALGGEIEQLALKDFAYLVRFRLAQEGQGLLEYLEWFFGECLLHDIARNVDASIKSDGRLKSLDGQTYEAVEGAFEGPTKKVAELFHRVRLEPARSLPGRSFRMGDLYTTGTGKGMKVAAVMTPDCDLIERGNGRRSASRMLTVSGTLKAFDAPDASVSDFIILEGRHHNLVWNTKDLNSHEFGGWPAPTQSADDIKFVGTLRPLYAQELQRSVLSDLSRVGVAVAPAIGMSAAVKIIIRKKGGAIGEVPVKNLNGAPAYVVPSRGGEDKTMVVFVRRFASSLLEALTGVDVADLDEKAKGNFKQLAHPKAYERLTKLFKSGLSLEEAVDMGIHLTAKSKPTSGDPTAWCWICVSMASPS